MTQDHDPAHFWSELSAAVLLGLAAIATAWSSYQSARWGGIQADHYSEASALRIEASSASTAALQLQSVDLAMFSAWLSAYAERRDSLTMFIQRRFRPEFGAAFDTWLASNPRGNPHAPRGPFVLPEYRSAEAEKAARLTAAGERATADARAANQHSDEYVLKTVLLAIVLFVAGIAPQMRAVRIRTSMLIVGAILLAAVAVELAELPVA